MAVITISRQYATGGAIFAKELAKSLGFAYINKDIYKRIAEKNNISIDELKSIESVTGLGMDFFQKFINSDYIKRIIGRKDVSFEHNEIVATIEKTIKEFAAHDNIVIVGRAGQCILQNESEVYHVKIVKSIEERIKFLTDKGITEDGAESTVLRKDEERGNYIKKFYGKDWNNPELYHLILNMSKISFNQGIDIIKSLIET